MIHEEALKIGVSISVFLTTYFGNDDCSSLQVYLHLTSKRYHETGQIAEEILSNFQPGDDTDGTAVELNW